MAPAGSQSAPLGIAPRERHARTLGKGPRRRPAGGPARLPLRLIVLLLATFSGWSTAREHSVFDLQLHQLLDIRVISVAKKPQVVAGTAAAIHVINRADIRRSGATSVPEALRLAPGVQVARISSNQWAVTIRGFASRFANKLLVMIDGRTLYTPTFSGVFWDFHDIPMADIERIEVIRGPGSAVWGANAVNGIINIITRDARHSTGGLVDAAIGNETRADAYVRQGIETKTGALRGYAAHKRYDAAIKAFDGSHEDNWHSERAGFRFDGEDQGVQTSLQGEVVHGITRESLNIPSLAAPFVEAVNSKRKTFRGFYLMGSREWKGARGDRYRLQAYYDHSTRNAIHVDEQRDRVDIEFQHTFSAADIHEIVWGAGYRETRDDLTDASFNFLRPEQDTLRVYSAFVQDEIRLSASLRLILGTRMEVNDYTHFEWAPNLRVLWHPGPGQTIWGAVSRAFRTPSRAERGLRFNLQALPPAGAPTLVQYQGSDDFRSESLIAWEAGYRVDFNSVLSIDSAIFVNEYRHLGSTNVGTPFCSTAPCGPNPFIAPLNAENDSEGETYGFEVSLYWRPADTWRVKSQFSHIEINTRSTNPAVSDLTPFDDATPRNQASIHYGVDLSPEWTFDVISRYTDDIPGRGIEEYVNLDLRLAWSVRPDVELSVTGQNLLDGHQTEFRELELNRDVTEIERNVMVRAIWRF